MIVLMKATFTELPPFERHRQSYLNDESFREFRKRPTPPSNNF